MGNKAKKRDRVFRRLGPPGESPAVRRLRKLATKVTTLAQFERMVLTSDHPQEFRRMVEPMLTPGLPCCTRRFNEPHDKSCPIRLASAPPPSSLIVTPEAEAMRQAGVVPRGELMSDASPVPVLVGPDGRPAR